MSDFAVLCLSLITVLFVVYYYEYHKDKLKFGVSMAKPNKTEPMFTIKPPRHDDFFVYTVVGNDYIRFNIHECTGNHKGWWSVHLGDKYLAKYPTKSEAVAHAVAEYRNIVMSMLTPVNL